MYGYCTCILDRVIILYCIGIHTGEGSRSLTPPPRILTIRFFFDQFVPIISIISIRNVNTRCIIYIHLIKCTLCINVSQEHHDC